MTPHEYMVHAAVSYGEEQITKTIVGLEGCLEEAKRYLEVYQRAANLHAKADEVSFLINLLSHNMQARFRVDLLAKAYGRLVVASAKTEGTAP